MYALLHFHIFALHTYSHFGTVFIRLLYLGRNYIDKLVTVEEQNVALAVLRLLENQKLVIEGGGRRNCNMQNVWV